MSSVGLLIITFSWLMQYSSRDDRIQPGFVIFYMIGAVVLVVDGFLSKQTVMAVFNLCSLAAAWLVFSKMQKRGKGKKCRQTQD